MHYAWLYKVNKKVKELASASALHSHSKPKAFSKADKEALVFLTEQFEDRGLVEARFVKNDRDLHLTLLDLLTV